MYAKQSPVSSTGTTRSPLLKPHSENLIYDIHSTETSRNFILDADFLASQSRYLFCSFCQRVLQTKSGLTNHEKAHIRSNVKQKRLERYKKIKKARVYTCKECGEQFVQRGLLNKHAKTHINIIKCNFCNKTFTDRMEFEMHDAINDGKNYDSLNFPAHRTRSQSRLSCHSVTQTVRSISCDSFFNGNRTPVFDNECNQSSSRKRSPSKLSMSSQIISRKKSKTVSSWIEDSAYLSTDEFSDVASVQSYSTISDKTISPSLSDWRSAFIQDRFICSETNCMKTFPTLNLATSHEIVEHKKLALFRCNECKKRFTTRGNLQQHRIITHPDVLICVLCDNPQKGVAAIEEHILLHQKHSVKCDICSKMFLSKYYLDEHLKYKKHKNFRKTKGSILIRVDRRETRDILDVDNISSKLPVKLNLCDDSECTVLEDDIRMDDTPWRS